MHRNKLVILQHALLVWHCDK